MNKTCNQKINETTAVTLSMNRAVNVTTVPLRSPFRYPGGKTWLLPQIRVWLKSLQYRPSEFIEPFVGGGIASLTVAFEELADHVTMIELDDQVASVWHTILSEDAKWLADQIVNFDLTARNVEDILARAASTIREKAFQTIVRNRINRSGIIAPGAGRLKVGEHGKGIQSRWYPQTLKNRILAIAEIRDRITFIEGDGLESLSRFASSKKAAFFIDPPYTVGKKKAGNRLYTCSEVDHEELFQVTSTLAGDFLMTYTNDEKVYELARQHRLNVKEVLMKSAHHKQITELLISRDLSWLTLKLRN